MYALSASLINLCSVDFIAKIYFMMNIMSNFLNALRMFSGQETIFYKNKSSFKTEVLKSLLKPSLFLISSFLGLASTIKGVNAQIFLNPQNSSATRSSASINIDSTRCSSSGGDVPSLSLAVGADPYAVNYFNDFDINANSNRNSPFLGIVSLNIPLKRTNQDFDCSELHDLAVKKSKLSSLREMVDEQIITEDQYATAVQNLYKNIIYDESNSDLSGRIRESLDEIRVERDGAITIE